MGFYKVKNGLRSKMATEEIAEMEREYWARPYDDLVDAEIRKRYSVSQEFAILRQQAEKPQEYLDYYQYCEECKALVKNKQLIIKGES